MNKTELIDHIAQTRRHLQGGGRPRARRRDRRRAHDAQEGRHRDARRLRYVRGRQAHWPCTGRNPRTGDAIKIKAAKVPKFRPGKALKDALN